jgi:PAS domain S-box-containing protein
VSSATPTGPDPRGDPGPAAGRYEGFSGLVEGVTEYAVFLLDVQGRIQSWNRGAERTEGFRRAEIIGESVARFYLPADVATGVPAEVLRRAALHGCDVTQGWRLRSDGLRFWASVVTTALYDERRGVCGYLKIVHDDTIHHAEEQKEATAIQWLHILTEACPVALLLIERPDADRAW